MTPYVVETISSEDIELFKKIRNAIVNLPDIAFAPDETGKEMLLSCHILARAVARVFFLKYSDGYLYPNYEHSWVLTSNGNIVDVYPVAVYGGPFLIDGSFCSPARWLYKKKRISRGRFSKPSFKMAVRIVAGLLKDIKQ